MIRALRAAPLRSAVVRAVRYHRAVRRHHPRFPRQRRGCTGAARCVTIRGSSPEVLAPTTYPRLGRTVWTATKEP
eukprot:6187392-Pleurochrysis_carterae.AAC.1